MGCQVKHKMLEILIYCKAFICIELCSIHSNILANSSRSEKIFDSISDQFSTKSAVKDQQFGEFFLLIISGVVLVFVAWLAYQFILYRKRISSPDTPWGLYKKLCQVHNLSVKEKYVIRMISRQNGLEDPLPLFVEPNYFKQVLADETMYRYHLTTQNLLNRLFASSQVQSPQKIEIGKPPLETSQELNTDENSHRSQSAKQEKHETVHAMVNIPMNIPDESDTGHFEKMQTHAGGEKQSPPPTKVLLNPIPGQTAFSSLVEPFRRLSTEIAATSIQHNLTDGRGMNERTYDAMSELRRMYPESQSPLFPKVSVPSPDEMLTEELRRTDQRHSFGSPTPQYLRTYKVAPTGGLVKRQGDARVNRITISPKPGEGLSFEDIARLETIVSWK